MFINQTQVLVCFFLIFISHFICSFRTRILVWIFEKKKIHTCDLAYCSWKPKWSIYDHFYLDCVRSSVCLSVCIFFFLHFWILQNYYANFKNIWQKALFGKGGPTIVKINRSFNTLSYNELNYNGALHLSLMKIIPQSASAVLDMRCMSERRTEKKLNYSQNLKFSLIYCSICIQTLWRIVYS